MANALTSTNPVADSVPAAPSRYAVLLVLIGLLAYSNSYTKSFVFDDVYWLYRRTEINDPLAYLKAWLPRPVIAATLLANHHVGEFHPFGYHLVNLGIHLGAALTLFGIVRRTLLLPCWGTTGRLNAEGTAFAVALLWMVHPLQTQSVTYVIQRCESLMGLLFLLTLYCFIRGFLSQNRGWYLGAVLCSAVGMGVKEVAAMAPLIVLLYDAVFLSISWSEPFRKRWGFHLSLFATWSILGVLLSLSPTGNAGFGYKAITPATYALTQPGVILRYLQLSFWPSPDSLCLDYHWPLARSLGDALFPGLVLTAVGIATVWGLFRRSWLGFVGAWFFIILGPTSSFMPIADVIVEHRMYLPLAAVAVLAVIGAEILIRLLGHRYAWSETSLQRIGGGAAWTRRVSPGGVDLASD